MEWVAIVGGRYQCFLDGPGADPTQKVQQGPRFVIGSGPTRSAKWLLTYDCTGRFVVDVEVAGCVFQCAHGVVNGIALTGKYGPGECILACAVYRLKRAFEVVGRVDVEGNHRTENLFFHGFEMGVGGENDRGVDEIPCAVITGSATQDFCILMVPRIINVSFDLVEGPAADNGADEILGISGFTYLQRADFRDQLVLDFRPQIVWKVDPAGGAALLSLEFKSAADDACDHFVHLSGSMGQDKVLASCLSYYSRVGAVGRNVVSDGLPEVAEHACASSEMEACEIGVIEDDIPRYRSVHGYQIDHALGQSCGMQQFHDHMGGVNLFVGRFPDDDISHQCRRNGEVSGDGGEVERCDGKDKAFQRPVFESVPDAGCAFGLLRIDLLGEVGIEPQEVNEFACGVNLRLVQVFTLGKHGGSVDARPPRAGEHFCRFEEDARPLFPVQGSPAAARFQGGIYR